MISRPQLLSDLQRLLAALEADLLERSESADVPEVGQMLRADYEHAREAERTAQSYEAWRSDYITQMAASWVLSCVFVRFLEDNRLIEPPKLAGAGDRLRRARDEHEVYFRSRPKLTDREYLLAAFNELAELPGGREVFGLHNAINEAPNWLSGDAAGQLLEFFQRIDADTGKLRHDFTDPGWDTRFLGDLYQDLSEAARKKYALLQTPEFVEEFILDRTLEPALDEFGLEGFSVLGLGSWGASDPQTAPPKTQNPKPKTQNLKPNTQNLRPAFRLIDPACGSGHFLLGAFPRILARWQKQDPSAKPRDLVQRALDGIYGVDVNPYAVAIARFRLLLAAMRACDIARLADAPAFHFNLVCGDSLLHGVGEQQSFGWRDVDHATYVEDLGELQRILVPGRYHAVVANPPYITPKDRALNQAYRERYRTCHMKYSLAVPFMERIFRLAAPGGFTGQITANSFMKREFGKKLIEEFLPAVDLTHVIDTSGAYIPGHGTPTVILFGRQRKPLAGTIRTVMGIRGEPATPNDPAQGLVWSAITSQIDQPGSQSEFVSVADSSRELFAKHPWSIGGGGAAELKEQLEEGAEGRLGELADAIGITAVTGEDQLFMQPASALRRTNIELQRPLVEGDVIRDWTITSPMSSVWLYDHNFDLTALEALPHTAQLFWQFKSAICRRKRFGTPLVERGFTWYEWQELYRDKLRTPLSIVFAEVATHNHFVLDRGGKVFNRTAPVVKLPPEATEDDHLALLGFLNSSTACFWLKQVCHQKQMMGGDGIRIESRAKVPYAFNATQVGRMPMPGGFLEGPLRDRLCVLTRKMLDFTHGGTTLTAFVAIESGPMTAASIRLRWKESLRRREELRARQILIQEEIDFLTYRMFGLVTDDLLSDDFEPAVLHVAEGDRPFCIVEGANEDGFDVPLETPSTWPAGLRVLWDRRINAIRMNPELRLIENSMYKRRWIGRQGLFNHQRTDDEIGDAARSWLLDRLESYFDFDGRMNDAGAVTAKLDIALTSVARLADIARRNADFMQVGELYRDDPAFDVQALVAELVEAESVPMLPILRYKPAGLRKRAEWEKTWELQRQEDAEESSWVLGLGSSDASDPQSPTPKTQNLKPKSQNPKPKTPIPVPPKYTSADFLKSNYWRLRGKLDVPKERWISFPHCEGPDGTLAIAWAGYDHLQLAQSISAYYVEVQERFGGRDDLRLLPLLACLIELLPWLKQWHNEPNAAYEGLRMGDYFEGFIQEEARQLGKTQDEIKAWQPPARTGRRRRM